MSQPTALESDVATAVDIECPPTDLWSDEPPLESDFHRDQIDLLIQILRHWWRDRSDVYVSGNLTVYYNERQLKSRDFRGPDFFVVLGTENKPRKSWVVWGENGQYPNFIVEILSSSTAKADRGLKKDLYQNVFRTPDYFLFDPETFELEGFHLVDGQYQTIQPDEANRLWSEQLGLYLGVEADKLRFFTPEGERLPSPAERADQARERVEQAEARAAQAEAELARLRAQIQAQGIELNDESNS